jgi:hypothetical protein
MMTLSPTAKLAEVSTDFFVPKRVVLVMSTVTVLPLRVRIVHVLPSIDWMVARNASRFPPAGLLGEGVAVAVGAAIGAEFDDVSEAVTAELTPQAVSPEARMTATSPAVTPDAIGWLRNTEGWRPVRVPVVVLAPAVVLSPVDGQVSSSPVAPWLAAAEALSGGA